MNSMFKHRNISEIIAARKNPETIKVNITDPIISPSNGLQESDSQIDWLLKKGTFTNEDKMYLLGYVEKKYRLYFTHHYNISFLHWGVAKDKTIIDKNFDSKKRSYFVLKGKFTLSERTNPLYCNNIAKDIDFSIDKTIKYQVIVEVEAGTGIGKIFEENNYSKCLLQSEDAVFMQFEHDDGQLAFIEKNCLLTRKERQTIISQSSLLSNVQGINKYYLPLFLLKKYEKDDYIFKIGDQSQYLYLIVDGEINFQSKINKLAPQCYQNIRPTDSKNERQTNWLVTTESLSRLSYFGQEQIFRNIQRRQNARCHSLSCLLFLIPLYIVEKLLYFPDLVKTLKTSAAIRNSKRNQKLTTIQLLQNNQNIQDTKFQHPQINFQDFKAHLYKSLSNKPKYKHAKISLANNNKIKVIHGNSINKLPVPSTINPERFSMLQVNMATYNSTIKRFRFSLDVLHNHNRFKTEEIKGRSISQVCKILNIDQIYLSKRQLYYEDNEGMDYYDSHIRFYKHLQTMKSYKAKDSKKNQIVKTQYINYLKEMI